MKMILILENSKGMVVKKREFDRISITNYDRLTSEVYNNLVKQTTWYLHCIETEDKTFKCLVYDTERIPKFGDWIETIKFTGTRKEAFHKAWEVSMMMNNRES